MAERKHFRCAIYTRKSSEEGLEQDFNSLDAQREACAAYIKSQKHEGWTELPARYDDGGFSGGNMERPGLVRLLDDIRAKRVDVIVVYKVDRLTRSLADFAKIVEVLDAQGVSFVAVTQQFNTTTSMGRLTLNVLLSFAQFEREIAGERIRDKIKASRQKGMWMGGSVPLGYEVKDRALVVNKTEAKKVRLIFRRYVELGSVRRARRGTQQEEDPLASARHAGRQDNRRPADHARQSLPDPAESEFTSAWWSTRGRPIRGCIGRSSSARPGTAFRSSSPRTGWITASRCVPGCRASSRGSYSMRQVNG